MKHTILTIVFSFVSFSILIAQKPDEAKVLIYEGIDLHDKGEYQKAIDKYNKALKLDKDNFYAMYEKASSLLSLYKNKESIEICQKIIEIHPTEADLNGIYVCYGNALDGLKKSEEALEIYNEGIKRFPDYYQLYFNKGITLSRMGNLEDGILTLQQSININPKHGSSHNALAKLEYANYKNIPALLILCRFLAVEPEGNRAKENLEIVQEILKSGIDKTGKNAMSISVDASTLSDTLPNGKSKENSFGSVQMILSITSSLDFISENTNSTSVDNFNRKIEALCGLLKEQKVNNYGFYWEYYAPYFIEMKEEGFLETFSYIVFASSDQKYVNNWLKGHNEELKSFFSWSNEFNWKTY